VHVPENLKFDQVQDILSHVEWGYTTYSKVNMKYFNPLAWNTTYHIVSLKIFGNSDAQ
jgi:hypothetical protein